jgi:hypothetical protein
MNQTPPQPPPEAAPAARQGFLAEFAEAFNRRTFFLVIDVPRLVSVVVRGLEKF